MPDKLSAGMGPTDTIKGPKKLGYTMEGGTTRNQLEMNIYIPQNMEWPTPDKLSAGKGPPDRPKVWAL